MANSCILAREIPWTEEPGRLEFMDSERVGHGLATEHAHSVASLRVDLAFRRNLCIDSWRAFSAYLPQCALSCKTPNAQQLELQSLSLWSFQTAVLHLDSSSFLQGGERLEDFTSLDFSGTPVLLCLVSQCLKAVVSYVLPSLTVTHGRKVRSILDIHSQKAAEVTHL